jgi:hypothetical protein
MRLRADFNGLFGEVLCLSHKDTALDEHGDAVALQEGMSVTAYDEDLDEDGNRDDLVASGIVGPTPPWLSCRGSRWILNIDEHGVRSQSEINALEGRGLD